MKIRITKKGFLTACISALLAAVAVLLADGILVLSGGQMPLSAAMGLFAVAALLLFRPCRKHGKRMLKSLGILLGVLAAAAVLGYGCWMTFGANAGYRHPDAGKAQLFADRKVMLVVPHQDDDINILGGVMEEYVRYGSQLYPVFVTNGDYMGLTEARYREAIAVFQDMGVPEENVIFLGYGNEWQVDGPHIYNAEPGTVVTSWHGRTETYGTQDHPAYREGRAYTIDNLTEDLKAVILEYRPDVIFCSDYDHHIDHKSTTLLFDKVMGMLLKENPDYTPVVYKAYAYGTAWEAAPDYYGEVVGSTRNHFGEEYGQKPAVYRWEDRVRFPVSGSMLSRSLVGSDGYRQLGLYESQGAKWHAASILNGDKVAWQRYTDSLCLRGDISASSGNPERLNDFMLMDNRNLADAEHMPYDGVWTPELGDAEKMVTVTLPEPSDISVLLLYDHPSAAQNVRNVRITFDNGAVMMSGPLDADGAATAIRVDQKAVASFAIELTETEGELAGLSEIEAYAEEPAADGRFLKLTDGDGNFLYDYWTRPDGTAEFALYTHGSLPEVTAEQYHVGITGEAGTAVLEEGKIRVSCPVGESFVLNVTCSEAGVSDNILVQNPGRLVRLWFDLWQGIEEYLYMHSCDGTWNRLLLPATMEKIAYVLRHL